MWSLKVKKRSTLELTHEGSFETVEQANEWKNSQIRVGAFGRNDRWIEESIALASGENLDDAIETQDQVTPLKTYKMYHFESDYIIDLVDTAIQESFDKKLKTQKLAREFGEYLIDYISIKNRDKGLTETQVALFMSQPLIKNISDLLKVGAIPTAKALILGNDVSAYFTNDEKLEVLALINNKLAELST